MFNVYVIYLTTKNGGDIVFSPTYSSFNKATSKIDEFLEEYFEKRKRTIVHVNKEELEKTKKSIKKNDTNIYVRKKKSQAILYELDVSEGRVYNSYSLEKFGQVGVSEFSVKVPTIYLDSYDEEEESEEFEVVPISKVTNYEHGTHVSFISELKSVLSNRTINKELEIPKSSYDNSKMEMFVADLVKGKETLNHVTPPVSPKMYLDEEDNFYVIN